MATCSIHAFIRLVHHKYWRNLWDTHPSFENKNVKNLLIDFLFEKFCKPPNEAEPDEAEPDEAEHSPKSSCQSDIPAAILESLPTNG